MLERTQEGPVAILTLAASGRRNALSSEMIARLREAVAQVGAEASTRCLLLAAEGPAFSAGHDLQEIRKLRAVQDGGRAGFEAVMEACVQLMLELVGCPVPVMACVEGVATAAGCQLVASCDLAVAGEHASFCTPGVNIGLFCATPSVALLDSVPAKAGAEMLFTGRPIEAMRAREIGLVNRVVAAGTARAAGLAWAREIAGGSPEALRRGKALLAARRLPALRQAYALASRAMVENLLEAEADEGIGAFLDKRMPNWQATPRWKV